MTIQRRNLGKWGEETAKKHLLNRGYLFIDQNWRTRFGELDLIMMDKETVVFIEVRTKSNSQYGFALESINQRKRQKLFQTAQAYLQSKKCWERPIRFDLISIDKIQGKYQLRHIKDIIH
ncbi:YraN family protein [Tepidibacillus marianensis]|uniref:YraN family protein n=1 Tax=Tepidibacillus marianensis TaxID=3131995 RepID=UPI0030D24C89